MSVLGSVGSQRLRRRAIPVVSPGLAQVIGPNADRQKGVRRGEILRKTMHMTPGLLPFSLALIPHPRTLDWMSLVVLAVLTATLTMVYIASKKIVRRPDETDFYSTCLSYPACILATLFLFPQHPEFTCVVAVVLAFGDGSAYIGGNLLGRRKLPWNPKKTWAGLICFVVVAAPVSTLAYWIEANASSLAYWGTGGPTTVPFAMAALCATTATVMASLAESWPTKLTDNLRVGVAASCAVIAAHYLLAGWFLA